MSRRQAVLRPLWAKSLSDRRKGIFGWCAGIVGIITIQMSVYPSIRSSATDWQSLVETFPEAIQKMLRMADYGTDAGYLSTELFTFMMPIIFVGLGASWGARLSTEDEESGNADIILSLPISRAQFITTRFAAAYTALMVGVTTMFLSLIVGARLLDMIIPISKFAGAAVMVLLLGAMALTVAAFIGAASGHRGVALGLTLSTFIAMFVLYSLAPLVKFIDAINPFNPLQWTMGSDPLISGIDLGPSVAALVIVVVCQLLTYVFFQRRDIRG